MALTYEEDGDLRRLAVFEKFGMLIGETERRYDDLRQRDRREAVREPTDIVDNMPAALQLGVKREWGT
jgi:hypothetical protein